MAEQGYVLTAEEVLLLRELVQRHRQQPATRPPKTYYPENDPPAPEVYVALSPPSGISANRDEPDSVGSDVGSAVDLLELPGYADCDIYRILEVGTAPPFLDPVDFTRTVYNLSGSAVPPNVWMAVVRDKYGHWLTLSPYGSPSPTQPTSPPHPGGDPPIGDCTLAALDVDDCLLAVNQTTGQAVEMFGSGSGGGTTPFESVTPGGPHWSSAPDTMTYPKGAGVLAFWFAGGILHLSLDGMELLGCGNGCWTGGPLTGHVKQDVSGTGSDLTTACGGDTFTVCLHCIPCVGTGSMVPCGCPTFGIDDSLVPPPKLSCFLQTTNADGTPDDVAITLTETFAGSQVWNGTYHPPDCTDAWLIQVRCDPDDAGCVGFPLSCPYTFTVKRPGRNAFVIRDSASGGCNDVVNGFYWYYGVGGPPEDIPPVTGTGTCSRYISFAFVQSLHGG